MKEEYIIVANARIAYYIKNPAQPHTIFFIHGNSSSSETWRKQVDSSLLKGYRLITIDLPSHGNSDEIDPLGDFSLPAIAKTVGTAIEKLIHNKPYIVCSVSLGTNIVAEMMGGNFSPKGLVFAGPCIVGEDINLDKVVLAGADVSAVFAENVPEEKVIKYAKETSVSTDIKDIEHFLKDYYAVKGTFRSSLYASIGSGIYNDEIAILRKKNCPACIVFGEDEKVVNTDYLNNAAINVWNNTIYKIPGASHLLNIDAPDAFNELLAAFAKDRFTAGAA